MSLDAAERAVRDGDLDLALTLLQEQVRHSPARADLRVFLFQLLGVLGQWDRALTQLDVAAEMDPATLAMAQMYREAIRCEQLRTEVFAGRRSPLVFGEPEPWVAWIIEALAAEGGAQSDQAQELRSRAFDAAPASAGAIDAQPFEWIADADMRLGPICEAVINGRYYWIPFARLSRIDVEVPADLRDVVWTPAHFQFVNGGETVGVIPTRYAGSETDERPAVRLARQTVWREVSPEMFAGLGQRIFATDAGEHSIMDVRAIVIGDEWAVGREKRMAELTPQERLQPALLDRLTDDEYEPGGRTEPIERRVMSKSRLRQAVLRDLAWLFNATRAESGTAFEHVPYVRRSVVNFGLPALSGRASSSMDIAELERAIRQAVLDFEPRILPASLEVRAVKHSNPHEQHNIVGVQIQGQLWAQPVPIEMLVRTEIDLETGTVEIADLLRSQGDVMDPRLIRYYNRELQHLHEMGAEFAREFPKVAARLGMNELEVADPYVERLLEGVAFLAARVQLKIDAEFPRFTQALLEIVHPHYLAPTPSMVVVQMKPDPKETSLASGTRTVPRGTTMQAEAGAEATPCEFRTAQDVTLWPVEVATATYFSYAPDLPLNALPIGGRIKGGVRIRLKTSGVRFSQMPLDRLVFFLTGADEVANKLYELCLGTALGTMVTGASAGKRWHALLPAASIRPIGFADDQALLPVSARSFQGHRLLQEYFAFPQRFRFIEVVGLQQGLRRADSDEVEIVLLFGRAAPKFENVVDASNFALFCTPAINLLPRRLDRIHVTEGEHEFHVVPDRTRPLDFEIYEISDVVGFGVGSDSQQLFLPFYAAYATHEPHHHAAAYFTVRREPRLVSSGQKRRGPRSSYQGTEIFLSLVDPAQAPYSGSLRQLAVQGLCTNRDLVLQMPVGSARGDFTLDISAPVVSVRVAAGPSRPFAPLADGNVAWRVISHLALNYLSLANSPGHGAEALRNLLELYAPSADAGARKQAEGLRSVRVAPVVRRLQGQGPLAFGRGLEITMTIDEMAFEGASGFLLGSVLHRFLSRHASINSFTETVLQSEGRGEIGRWEPQWGARPTL